MSHANNNSCTPSTLPHLDLDVTQFQKKLTHFCFSSRCWLLCCASIGSGSRLGRGVVLCLFFYWWRSLLLHGTSTPPFFFFFSVLITPCDLPCTVRKKKRKEKKICGFRMVPFLINATRQDGHPIAYISRAWGAGLGRSSMHNK
jgi:hypothetical protein